MRTQTRSESSLESASSGGEGASMPEKLALTPGEEWASTLGGESASVPG